MLSAWHHLPRPVAITSGRPETAARAPIYWDASAKEGQTAAGGDGTYTTN
jgi:hypothetical protein